MSAAVAFTQAYATKFQPSCAMPSLAIAPALAPAGWGSGSGSGGVATAGGPAPVEEWVLLAHQPKGFGFKLAEAQDEAASFRVFEHRLKWQEAFRAGASLRFGAFPGQDGFTFTLPATADATTLLTIRARVERAATRAVSFRASELMRKRTPEEMAAASEAAVAAAAAAVAAAPAAARRVRLARRARRVRRARRAHLARRAQLARRGRVIRARRARRVRGARQAQRGTAARPTSDRSRTV